MNKIMIDRTLNYARHTIRQFLKQSASFRDVLDLGAGSGHDLEIAGNINPAAKLMAVELSEPNIMNLESRLIEPHKINIEKESLPFIIVHRLYLISAAIAEDYAIN